MAYATLAARNAYQRRWRVTNRAHRALMGLCRDCPRSCVRRTRQTVLCEFCYMKAYQRRPDALMAFNEQKRQMRAGLQPLRDDRRRNGKTCAALAWASELRGV